MAKGITKNEYSEIERVKLIQEICILTAPMWNSKTKRMKPRMTIIEACEQVGIAGVTYQKWLEREPKLRQFVDELKASQRSMVADLSEKIIFEALNGDTKIRPMEKIQLAKWTLEKTEKNYNPGQKIEVDNKVTTMDMSEEEILARLAELEIVPTKINDNITYEFPTTTDEEKSI